MKLRSMISGMLLGASIVTGTFIFGVGALTVLSWLIDLVNFFLY